MILVYRLVAIIAVLLIFAVAIPIGICGVVAGCVNDCCEQIIIKIDPLVQWLTRIIHRKGG